MCMFSWCVSSFQESVVTCSRLVRDISHFMDLERRRFAFVHCRLLICDPQRHAS